MVRAALLRQYQDAVFSYFRYLPMDLDGARAATIAFFRRLFGSRPPRNQNVAVWLFQELLVDPTPPQRIPAASPAEEALRRVSGELQQLLVLHEIAGLPIAQVAEVFQITPALARSRLSRARAGLLP